MINQLVAKIIGLKNNMKVKFIKKKSIINKLLKICNKGL